MKNNDMNRVHHIAVIAMLLLGRHSARSVPSPSNVGRRGCDMPRFCRGWDVAAPRPTLLGWLSAQSARPQQKHAITAIWWTLFMSLFFFSGAGAADNPFSGKDFIAP